MSEAATRWLAPAKLNLFLHVTGRRPNGYHELQTVFQLLDYGDELKVSPDSDGTLSLHLAADSPIKSVPMDGNLILRAATALREHVGEPALGARIALRKNLAMGAGLGGGSSDAASTLLALNKLWDLHLEQQALARIGLDLGADVPVFLGGQSAWAEGVGEHLQPLQLPPSWYLVITPACEVSTEKIFTQQDLTRNSPAIKIADFLAGRARNDCESVTRKLYPQVDEALNWLAQHGQAKMTGTGASVFANFTDSTSAHAVLQQLPDGWTGFVAKGVNSLEQQVRAT